VLFKPLTYHDLDEIRDLRPDDWPDITPDFEFYIKSSYCTPIKTEKEARIVGIGSLITFDDTCWIGHMIVDKNFRNRGIGQQIVRELLGYHQNNSTETCLLIASELGRSVYLKAGFRDVTEYTFMQREKSWKSRPINQNVISFREEHLHGIYELDRKVTGENRKELLSNYLNSSKVFFKNNKVQGFYLPDLKEGLIIADTEEAGMSLMEIKYAVADKAILPSDNIIGLKFLEDNGYVKRDKKGTRMIYGKEIHWEPQKIYSRIGGNLG